MLDLRRGSSAEVQRSLADLRRLNTYLGGTEATVHDTMRLLRHHGLARATVVDIGTGAADTEAVRRAWAFIASASLASALAALGMTTRRTSEPDVLAEQITSTPLRGDDHARHRAR